MEYLRPNLVEIEQCDTVLLDGPTFENSPKHNILPSHCENVIIRNVVIYNCTVDVGIRTDAILFDMYDSGGADRAVVINGRPEMTIKDTKLDSVRLSSL